jgi:hypothetical protein
LCGNPPSISLFARSTVATALSNFFKIISENVDILSKYEADAVKVLIHSDKTQKHPDLMLSLNKLIQQPLERSSWNSSEVVDSYRQILGSMNGVHDAGERFWFEMDRMLGPEQATKARNAFPSVMHPVITAHPVTGEPLLFVNPGYTVSIDGLTAPESR